MPLPTVARGALIGGGVGPLLAVARRSPSSTSRGGPPGTAGRIAQVASPRAPLAGAAVGASCSTGGCERARRSCSPRARRSSSTPSPSWPGRYEPAVERFAEAARDRAVDAYEVAYPRVVERRTRWPARVSSRPTRPPSPAASSDGRSTDAAPRPRPVLVEAVAGGSAAQPRPRRRGPARGPRLARRPRQPRDGRGRRGPARSAGCRSTACARCVDVLGDPQQPVPGHPPHRHERQGLDRPDGRRRSSPSPACRSAPTPAPTSSGSTSGSVRNGEPIGDDDAGRGAVRPRRPRAARRRRPELVRAPRPRPPSAGSPRSPSTSPWSRSACSGATTPPTSPTGPSRSSPTSAPTTPTSSGTGAGRSPRRRPGIVKPGSTLVLGETDLELRPIFDGGRRRRGLAPRRGLRLRREPCSPSAAGCSICAPRTAPLDDVFLPAARRPPGRQRAPSPWPPPRRSSAGPSTATSCATPSAAVALPGRFEVVGREPLVVLDGAHNPDGAAVAAETLADDFDVAGDRILVVGHARRPGPRPMLEALDAARADSSWRARPDSPRAVPAARGRRRGRRRASASRPRSSPTSAGRRPGPSVAGPEDAVLVTGSLYVVGAARAALS